MKFFIKPGALVLVTLLLFDSCKKENDKPLVQNHPPVADAGADVTINITSCSSSRSAELDGSGSFDPDEPNDKIYYEWTKISGPICDLSGSLVTNLSVGQYMFELKVTDVGGLSSKDTVVVNVKGSAEPLEISLDAIINGSFVFDNNYKWCDIIPPWGEICIYYDITRVEGSFDQPELGQMFLNVSETSDTTIAGDSHNTQIFLGCSSCNGSLDVSGTCSVNFKKLIQTGGGSFNGTFNIETGSAKNNCGADMFTNLAPLTIMGSLDTTSHGISLTIKGKAYF